MTKIRLDIENRADGARVATVTVDRPAKLNILDPAAIAALERAVAGLASDDALRVAVLRGAGGRAFIGGADIEAMSTLRPASARGFITQLHRACEAIRRLPVPVIARIEGFALGAGLEIAASCDLRIAADSAKFGMPEVKVGIPSVIEAALLPRLIGWGRARWLLYTGEIIGAEVAESWGLVERVVAPADLDAAVEACVAAILAAEVPRRPVGRAGPRRRDRARHRCLCRGVCDRRAGGAHGGILACACGSPAALAARPSSFIARLFHPHWNWCWSRRGRRPSPRFSKRAARRGRSKTPAPRCALSSP